MDEHGQSRAKGRGINQDCAGTMSNGKIFAHLSCVAWGRESGTPKDSRHHTGRGESQRVETKHPVSKIPLGVRGAGRRKKQSIHAVTSAHAHAQMRKELGGWTVTVTGRERKIGNL